MERPEGLPSVHPLHSTVELINRSGPFIGLVMAYRPEAEALESSGEFVPSSGVSFLDLYGRRFHIGSIRGVDVIYVLSGQRRLNAGITVQMLLDNFDVRGIVHYGTAGSANNSMSFGDVSVPKFLAFTGITVQMLLDNFDMRGIVHYGTAGSANNSMSFGDVSVPKFLAFTGSWTWTKFGSKKDELPELRFETYNVPEGINLLSGVEFKPEELYSDGKSMEEVFWMQVNQEWFEVAEQLEVELERCANETYCLPDTPKIVSGLKASTADVFVDNVSYREFLFNEFGVSTVDEESAAIVMTAISPGVPVIVFRGVSDLAGQETWSSTSLIDLASINSLKVALEFVRVIGKKKLSDLR